MFQKFFSNWLFLGVLVSEFVIQFFLIGLNLQSNSEQPDRVLPFLDWIGTIFTTGPLNPQQWLFCITVGFVGFLWGFVLKLIPTPAEKVYKGQIEDIHSENSPLLQYVSEHIDKDKPLSTNVLSQKDVSLI